jgi:hypothetical protein
LVTADEIERIIRANIDKTVLIVDVDGITQSLFVHSVDEEGFACDLLTEMSEPPPCAYWIRFSDVREALPAYNFDEIAAAIERTDYAFALTNAMPHALAGSPDAQCKIALLYEAGWGAKEISLRQSVAKSNRPKQKGAGRMLRSVWRRPRNSVSTAPNPIPLAQL